MGIDNPIENEADNLLNAAYDEVFKEEVKEEPKEEVEETPEVSETEESDEPEITEEEIEDESTEEVEEENEIEEKEINLHEKLKGVFPKDYIDLLDSIDDPKLKNDLIDAGKKQRADLDRKRLEFGESKKLAETLEESLRSNNLNYSKQEQASYIKNLVSFDALFTKDPKLAIESLAKSAKIDLNTFGDKSVPQDDDYEDYRTPEEIKRDQEIETLKQELNLIKNSKQQESISLAQQELNNFANSKDQSGELKYPYFDKVRKKMGVFFDDKSPLFEDNITMEEAYNRAILLDSELRTSRDQDILRKAELKRKEQIEKVKKQKRQSLSSSSVKTVGNDPYKNLEKIVSDFGF